MAVSVAEAVAALRCGVEQYAAAALRAVLQQSAAQQRAVWAVAPLRDALVALARARCSDAVAVLLARVVDALLECDAGGGREWAERAALFATAAVRDALLDVALQPRCSHAAAEAGIAALDRFAPVGLKDDDESARCRALLATPRVHDALVAAADRRDRSGTVLGRVVVLLLKVCVGRDSAVFATPAVRDLLLRCLTGEWRTAIGRFAVRALSNILSSELGEPGSARRCALFAVSELPHALLRAFDGMLNDDVAVRMAAQIVYVMCSVHDSGAAKRSRSRSRSHSSGNSSSSSSSGGSDRHNVDVDGDRDRATEDELEQRRSMLCSAAMRDRMLRALRAPVCSDDTRGALFAAITSLCKGSAAFATEAAQRAELFTTKDMRGAMSVELRHHYSPNGAALRCLRLLQELCRGSEHGERLRFFSTSALLDALAQLRAGAVATQASDAASTRRAAASDAHHIDALIAVARRARHDRLRHERAQLARK